ncbi:MAG: phosphate regulon sensor protein PhoR, partial [Motiliproteus sp.]|nr:phosphate regulon sensor protein PhoR [Motiliproteus sp.]
MNPELQQQLKKLLILLLLATCVGWLAGSVPWALTITLGWLLGRNFWQLLKLQRWLDNPSQSDVPESTGLWGRFFDTIYRKERDHRASEAHLKAIINRVQESTTALKDGVLMVDAYGNIEWWNRSAKALLGLRRPDDVGQPVINLIRDPRFIRYFERRMFQEALEIPSPINSELHLQYTITEFGQSERLLLIRDVTRLNRLERMRQDFVGNASHELRTPLTVIQGYLETLQEQFIDHNPGLTRALRSMETQAIRMGNLVTDMLMLSRLETTDSLSDELPINIHGLISEIYDNALYLQPEKEHEITLDIEPGYLLLGQEKELV